MKKLFITLGVVFALLIITVSILATVMGIRHIASTTRKPSKPVVLHLDFSQTIVEHPSTDPFERLTGRGSITLLDFIRVIDHAAKDDNVQGIVADLSQISIGMAQAQDIRDALSRFRDQGKWSIAYADTYFVSATGTGVYYMASGFDEIYMHPTGDIGFTGLASEPLFFKNILDNLGIVSYMDQRHEYKLIANMFNEEGYTESHRESDLRLINSVFNQILEGVSVSRNMTVDHLRNLVDQAPFFGAEALDARLVDGFRFWDQIEDLMEEKTGGEIELIRPSSYLGNYMKTSNKDNDYVVGLVYGIGAVARGGGSSSLMSSQSMAANTISEYFRQIRNDGDVDIVVFRVSSPGGSPDASATIDREIQLTREAGIPVIVSMGDIAASGGYYVAMSADVIMAQPLTLTGSIGVGGGKFVVGGLMEKLGITTEETHVGDNALMLSMYRPPTESQHQRLERMMDKIYEEFTEGVMAGRNMTPEQIDEVARGRVWIGADAFEVDLVDELGGLYDALQKAREMIDVPPDKDYSLRLYPRKKSFLELIAEADGGFFTKAAHSIQTFVRLVNLLDAVAGNDLQDIERIVSGDTLTNPVSAYPFVVENR
jgi:protease IV